MSSLSVKSGEHCPSPSCNEQVQSNWKTCPFCSTPLTVSVECQSEKKEGDPAPDDDYAVGSHSFESLDQKVMSIYKQDVASGSDSVESQNQKVVPIDKQETEQCSTDCSNINGSNQREDECLSKYLDLINKEGVLGFTKALKSELEQWKETKVNIAIIGNSGTGKSSLINAIRGIKYGDEGYAKVGCTESTLQILKYFHPKYPNLVFWDLPGVGTDLFKRATYMEDIHIDNYDFFVIVSATRFGENDIWLAQNIHAREKAYYFVRSKIDNDVYNERKETNGRLSEEQIIHKIREDIVKQLGGKKLNKDCVFLVNNQNILDYDFDALMKQLVHDTPTLLKEALVFSMTAKTKNILDAKKKALNDRSLIVACLSVALFAIPIPGVRFLADVGILWYETLHYREQFGIDDASLEAFAKETNVSVEYLINHHKLSSATVSKSFTSFDSFLLELAAEDTSLALAFIPLVGTLAARLIHVPQASRVVGNILDMCYKEALTLMAAQQDQLSSRVERVALNP